MTDIQYLDDGSTLHGSGCFACGNTEELELRTSPWGWKVCASKHQAASWWGFTHDEYARRVSNTLATVPGRCTGCGCPEERCRSLWPEQKKCCPECSHGLSQNDTRELLAWLDRRPAEPARAENPDPGCSCCQRNFAPQSTRHQLKGELIADGKRLRCATWFCEDCVKSAGETKADSASMDYRANREAWAAQLCKEASRDGAKATARIMNALLAAFQDGQAAEAAARTKAQAEEPKSVEVGEKPQIVRCTFCNDEHPIAVPPAVGSVHYFSANDHFICEVCVDICAEYLSGFRENQQSGEAIDPLYQLLLALNRIAARGGIWADETAALIEKLYFGFKERDQLRSDLTSARAALSDRTEELKAAREELSAVVTNREGEREHAEWLRAELAKLNERNASLQHRLELSHGERRLALEENARLTKELEGERERTVAAVKEAAHHLNIVCATSSPDDIGLRARLQAVSKALAPLYPKFLPEPTDSAAKEQDCPTCGATFFSACVNCADKNSPPVSAQPESKDPRQEPGIQSTHAVAGSPVVDAPGTGGDEHDRDIAIMALIDVIERPHPGRAGEFIAALERMFGNG